MNIKKNLLIRTQFINQFKKDNQALFVVLIFLSILISVVELTISIIVQQIIDIATSGVLDDLLYIIMITGAFIVFFVLVFFINNILFPKYIYKCTRQYKVYSFNKIIENDIVSFRKKGSSEFISALTNDMNTIEENYISSIFDMITSTVTFVGAFIIMLIYNIPLTIVAVCFSFVPVISILMVRKKAEAREIKVSTENASFLHFTEDTLEGFSVIKSFRAEDTIKRMFKENNDKIEDAKRAKKRTTLNIGLIGTTSGIIAQMGVFIFGAYLSVSGEAITAGTIMLFVQLMNYVIHPIQQIPRLLVYRKAAIPLIDKMAKLAEVNRDTNIGHIATFNRGITIQNLNFSYDEKIIIDDLSFKFDKNKSYALVGASGSGKSTLLNLIIAANLNYEGDISYDEVSLKDMNASSIFEIVSLIEQNVFVFDSTIIDNITMFKAYPDEEIEHAILKSGLKQMIDEKGIDYLCGDGGSNLSGGEKQRISIARALLRKSKILLVDEATSALDNETSFNISNELLSLDHTTKIVVTHRLEDKILSQYDAILVLKDGKLFECGTYDELMNQKGLLESMIKITRD
ncbi:MAG: ABC transporter ATP-binding protein [Bacilli bacterium]